MPPKPFEIYRRLLREGWAGRRRRQRLSSEAEAGRPNDHAAASSERAAEGIMGEHPQNRSVALRCEKARERTNHALHVSCDFHGERVGRL